jgi:hypothetical protein
LTARWILRDSIRPPSPGRSRRTAARYCRRRREDDERETSGHGVEQFLFGIDELYELKAQMAAVLGLFPNPDYGIVLLVCIAAMLAQLFVYRFLIGGRWRLLGPGFFGVAGLIESHHIPKTIFRGAYFPGAVTAIPFVMVGALLLWAVVRELRSSMQHAQ